MKGYRTLYVVDQGWVVNLPNGVTLETILEGQSSKLEKVQINARPRKKQSQFLMWPSLGRLSTPAVDSLLRRKTKLWCPEKS